MQEYRRSHVIEETQLLAVRDALGKGLEHKSKEEWLREPGLFSPEKKEGSGGTSWLSITT